MGRMNSKVCPALVALVVLNCSTRAAEVAPRSRPSTPVANSSARAAPPVAQVEPTKPQCALGDAPPMMAIRGDLMALRNGLDGIRARGRVALVRKPDDFDETYLARREVDEASLPAWIRESRNAHVTVLADKWRGAREVRRPEMSTSTVKAVAAFGLADESFPSSKTDAIAAREAIEKGFRFVGALLEVEKYSFLQWGTFTSPSELRAWETEGAPKELETAALREVRGLASYRTRQEEYRAFLAQIDAIAEKVETRRAKDAKARERPSWFEPRALPKTWEISSVKGIWTVTGPCAPGIVVVHFDEGAAEDVPERDGAGDDSTRIVFDGTITVVWSFSEGKLGAVLGEIIQPQGFERSVWNFDLRGAISTPASLPALLFTGQGVTGALQPVGGQYKVDEEHILRTPFRRPWYGK